MKNKQSAFPLHLTEPDLSEVVIELAEFALERGIHLNLAVDQEGSTMRHEFARLRDYPQSWPWCGVASNARRPRK